MSLTTKFTKKSAKNTKLVNLVKNLVFFVVKKIMSLTTKFTKKSTKNTKLCEPSENFSVLRG